MKKKTGRSNYDDDNNDDMMMTTTTTVLSKVVAAKYTRKSAPETLETDVRMTKSCVQQF